MGEIISSNSPLLLEAIRLWTGFGSSVAPDRSDTRLIAHFGSQLATEILPVIKTMEEEFYSSDAQFHAKDMEEMERISSEDFRKLRPDVAEEIVKALAWCYTFDYR